MKIRKGFVSNSSSSSFVCDVCGEEVIGMDIGLEDAEMAECEWNHIFCTSHTDKEFEDIYEVPEKDCPVCTFETILDEDMLLFLIKKLKLDKKEIVTEMRKTFKSYTKFQDYLK